MNPTDLANPGEFISGIAVIASLIYLAVQIRQNTQSVRGATLAGNTDIWASLLLTMADPKHVDALIASSPESDPGLLLAQWQDTIGHLEGSDPDAMH